MAMNPILETDSYKLSHFKQYPPGATRVSSYIEARKGGVFEEVMVFGTQILAENLSETYISMSDIDEAEKIAIRHGVPFNREGWEHIYHDYGAKLPIIIEALPDGLVVPVGTPMLQITTPDDPKLLWLTSYMETQLLRAIWYPSTVATLSYHVKKLIWANLLKTCDDPDSVIDFRLHDFGARGVSSSESARLGGMAHLVNFKGTDTLEAIEGVQHYYQTDEMPGYSVPAAEHSTITSWGEDFERVAYENMIDQFDGPDAIVSIVADSYDLFNAVENIFGKELKQKILNMKGTLVIRPDSGDPIATPLKVIDMLWDIFGGTVNSKGYKVLHPKVRVLQGDGMNLEKIEKLFSRLEIYGYSGENIVVGMGGGLLQSVNRDTLRFAMKASAVSNAYGEWTDVFKCPKTDPSKASKRGRLAVVVGENGIETIREEELNGRKNLLSIIYWEGFKRGFQEWDNVRELAMMKLRGNKQRVTLNDAAA